MKRRYSLAALGKREYLKMNAWLKTASSVGFPTGPMGKLAWSMSWAICGKSFLAAV